MKITFSAVLFSLCLAGCGQAESHSSDLISPGSDRVRVLSTAEECHDFIARLPSDVLRGWVEVPENTHDPQSPKLKIFYYARLKPGKEPILFINGGPGGDSHNGYRRLVQQPKVARWNDASLVFFDQRGNGCSSGYPQAAKDVARLRFYGSRGIVEDAEIIRQHLLGEKPWRVFGQSYGGLIAQRYVALYPEHILEAYSHGDAISTDPILRMANRVFAQNRVLNEYFRRYPEDRATLTTLHEFLTAERCYPNVHTNPHRCGLAVLDHFNVYLPFVDSWPRIHLWMRTFVRSGRVDEAAIRKFLNLAVFPFAEDPANRKGSALYVIGAYDREVPQFDPAVCDEIYQRLRDQGEAPENYLLHECMVAEQFHDGDRWRADRDTILRWIKLNFGTDPLRIADVHQSLVRFPALNLHLYSGYLDTMVPERTFNEEVQALGARIFYLNFPNSGHDGFYTEAQVAADIIH